MVNIIKEEIILDESLKKKIEFICEFAKVKPTIINGSIRRIVLLDYKYYKILYLNPTLLMILVY